MAALLSRKGNGHRALRAILRGNRRYGLGHPLVYRAHQEKYRKRDEQEIDERVDEISVTQGDAMGLCFC